MVGVEFWTMAIRTRLAAIRQTSLQELYARVGAANILLAVAIAVMVGLQIGQRWWLPNGFRFGVLHIAFAALIVALQLLTTRRSSKTSAKILPWLSIIIVVIWFAYFYPLADFEVGDRFGYATRPDMVIGALLAIPVFFLAWKSFGPLFPAIGLVAILYGFFAADVPGHFKGPPIPAERVISRYVLESSWSGLVRLFANFVWLIMFWGMLLEVAGAGSSLHASPRSWRPGSPPARDSLRWGPVAWWGRSREAALQTSPSPGRSPSP